MGKDEKTALLTSTQKYVKHQILPAKTEPSSSSLSSAASSSSSSSAKQTERAGTAMGSIFNLVNSAVGSGVLSFPWAYRSTGLGMALIVTLAAFAMTQLTQLVLIRMANRYDARTFQELVHCALGRRWAYATSVMVSLYIFGACCSYLIILSDALQVPIKVILPSHLLSSTAMRRLGLSIVGWGLVFPLCLARNLAALEKVSAATLVAALFILFVVAVRASGLPARDDISFFHFNDWLDPQISPLNAPPVAILAFQAHIQTVPIMYELALTTKSKQQSHEFQPSLVKEGFGTDDLIHWSLREIRMGIFVVIAGAICLLLYSAMGVLGYLTFGDHGLIDSNILDSYMEGDKLISVARVVVGLVMVVSYPVNQFCARSAVLDIVATLGLARSNCPERESVSNDRDGQVVAFLFFAATYTVALFVQNLGLVFDIVGATVGVYVILILPAALIYNDNDGMFPARVTAFTVLVLVGVAICISTLAMQVLAAVHSTR